ncbi:AP-4 complex accessory subunit Tepsin isoform X2 [Clupea harengus]|uniref:AP-4 complex accessory subunit Tepsin isoform X2 n=1 Tax=Clupea harengus TaxID=7950 RepID=A0A8M1KFP3_CLUHA|nr:AP-4 complex accessory subunit Tepsin isoform X2 [Clupea harengus]
MATLLERLAFLQKVPTLMKATSDDDTPCPGYLFEEIGKISHESVGYCQCLLEYLLERLQVQSCPVKIKVLKILLHLCGHGPPHLVTELRRNATFIQEVIAFSGPPDPIHGNAPYQRARAAARNLASLLFTDSVSPDSGLSPCRAVTATTGMGSESSPRSGMQGFGYSPVLGGGTFLDKIQKAAEVVASAVMPPSELPGIRLQDNHYRAVVAPSGVVEVAVPACAYSVPSHSHRVTLRCPGQVGGGWEENDSGHSSSPNSSQENVDASRASLDASSKSGGTTSSQSAASRESGDLSERVEAMQLGDCGQEMALITSLTEGSKVFLSREESQHFIKECSTLNCEVVVELLCRKLQESTQTVQMRAMCALACLMSSDLLSLEQIYSVTQKRLAQLSQGTPGPVTNKATKLLRQFEALLRCQTRHSLPSSATNSPTLTAQEHAPKPVLTDDLLLPNPILGSPATSKPHLEPEAQQEPEPYQEVEHHLEPEPHLKRKPEPPAGPSWSPHSDQNLGEDHGGGPLNHTEGPRENLPESGDVELDTRVDDPDTGPGGERETCEVVAPASCSPTLDRLSLFNGMELVITVRPSSHLPGLASVDTELPVASTTENTLVEIEEAELELESELAPSQHSDSDKDASVTQPSDDLGQDRLQVSAFSFLNL